MLIDNTYFNGLLYIPNVNEPSPNNRPGNLLGNLIDISEKEVLSFLVYGYSMSVIAKKLYLSVKTVSTYKMRLMQKLGCKDNHELVEYALRHNLLDKGKNG